MSQPMQDVLQLISKGDHKAATTRLLQLTREYPDNSEYYTVLGQCHHTLGNLDEAEQYFRKSLALNPSPAQPWHFLGLVLHDKGQRDEANRCLEKAEQADPFNPQLAQAQQAAENGRHEQCWQLCDNILKQQKNHPRALYMKAMICSQRGALERAANYLHQGLRYSPHNQSLLNFLSQIYVQLRQYPQAVDASAKLTTLQPDNERYWLLHANNLLNAANYDQAQTALAQALAHTDNPAYVHLQLGHLHKTLGNNAACITAYRQCLDSKETLGAAYWGLANLSDHAFDDADLQTLQDAQLDPDLSPEQACQAGFALARALEEREQYAQAFTACQSANLNRPGNRFIPDKYRQTCDALIGSFSAALFAQNPPTKTTGPDSATPIFIVGLPRSGSTLIEQILASHSQIEGTQELKLIPTTAKRVFMASREKNRNNSGDMSRFTNAELLRYGQSYLKDSQIYRSDKPFFIDKLPPNFQHIGLIQLILPQAIIIDARRQPLSCGFGIYKQYFGHGHDFSYDLQHIGFYYNQYLRLMDHWAQVLPDKILRVQYETMVEDTEKQVRTLLDHCGVPFEAQCLQFHQTRRAVKTASADQVRQPINRKGMELWHNYETQLQPLKEALGQETLARFGLSL